MADGNATCGQDLVPRLTFSKQGALLRGPCNLSFRCGVSCQMPKNTEYLSVFVIRHYFGRQGTLKLYTPLGPQVAGGL